MQLVERVARAICRATLDGINLEYYVDQYWHKYIPEARASIAIQRELIQQLRDALVSAETWLDNEGLEVTKSTELVEAADAALREQP